MRPLDQMGSAAGDWTVGVGNITSYREPWVNLGKDDSTPVNNVFADMARTAKQASPADPGQEAKNPNRLRERSREFVFLDVGRWLKDSRAQARDFGLIWGRHVYLCAYQRLGFADPPKFSREGLDKDFFVGMGYSCKPVNWTSATWAADEDFDWDHVYVIAPDMHLMAGRQAAIWYREGSQYMQPERDFWDFALRLASIESMRDKIKFVQIGDSFDLWVDCPEWSPDSERAMPFVPDTEGGRVVLADNSMTEVPKWVHRIQGMESDGQPGVGTNWVFLQLNEPNPSSGDLDKMPNDLHSMLVNRANEFSTEKWKQYVIAGPRTWRNPVDAAFKLLEDTFGSNVIYVYGNHDDVLAHADVCQAAGLKPRTPFQEFPGVFIEHGHRMEIPWEIVLHPVGGYNADGLCEKAWQSTNEYFDFLNGHNHGYAGWAETNVRLPDRFLPLFTPDWLKWTTVGLLAIIEHVPGGIKWVLKQAFVDENLPFHLPADISFATWFDQPWYIQEYAKVWVGRNSDAAGKQLLPPHIFVIGHTHLPLLAHMNIVRDTPARRRPKRLS